MMDPREIEYQSRKAARESGVEDLGLARIADDPRAFLVSGPSFGVGCAIKDMKREGDWDLIAPHGKELS